MQVLYIIILNYRCSASHPEFTYISQKRLSPQTGYYFLQPLGGLDKIFVPIF